MRGWGHGWTRFHTECCGPGSQAPLVCQMGIFVLPWMVNMNYEAYRVVEPRPETSPGRDFDRIATEWSRRCSRMLDAIEDFVCDPTTPGFRVAPLPRGPRYDPELGRTAEAYLVPFIKEEAVALVLADHEAKVISFIAAYHEFGGYENQPQWNQIIELADSAI
jgi:hypothetical protein